MSGQVCKNCGCRITEFEGAWWHLPTTPRQQPARWCRVRTARGLAEPKSEVES